MLLFVIGKHCHLLLYWEWQFLSLPFPCLAQVFIFSINIFPAAFIIWIQPDKEEPGMKVTRIFFLQQRSVGEVRKSSEF